MQTQVYPHVPVDPNDPRLHTPERERLPGEYVSTRARRLYQLGFENKADRSEDCAKKGRVGTCPNGHKSRQISLCGLRFCSLCYAKLLAELVEHWRPVLHLIELHVNDPEWILSKRFTYVEVIVPLERSASAMAAIAKQMHDAFLDRIVAQAHTGDGNSDFGDPGGWDFFAGYDAQGFHFRTLQLGDGLPLDAWQAIWPGAQVRVHVVPMYRIAYFFEKVLLAPFIPKDPVEQAEHEALFDGFHRLRNHGVYIGDGSPEDISVGFKLPTEMSDEDDQPEPPQEVKKAHPHGHRCPICKMAVTNFGPWASIDQINAELASRKDARPPN